jgi:hypothetical protein
MSIDNTEDIIDSREIIERIEELEGELLACFNEQQETEGFTVSDDSEEIYQAEDASDNLFTHWLEDCRIEEAAEYKSLKALAEECNGYGDWEYGEPLIRRSYFVDYISDLIHDCYEMPKEMHSGQWPYCHMSIDYEGAARDAEHDYMSVDFDGQEYLMRA